LIFRKPFGVDRKRKVTWAEPPAEAGHQALRRKIHQQVEPLP
jgi:hypothetical protein